MSCKMTACCQPGRLSAPESPSMGVRVKTQWDRGHRSRVESTAARRDFRRHRQLFNVGRCLPKMSKCRPATNIYASRYTTPESPINEGTRLLKTHVCLCICVANGKSVSKDHKKDFGRMFVFYEVAKHSSFTAAAKSMGMSRTMVTQTITGLEESFAIRLFHRTTRSFSLTEQGAKLFEHAAKMIAEFEEACRDLRSDARELKGRITLQIPGVLDVPQLHDILTEFLEANQQISYEIRTQDRVGDLVENQVDIALHVGSLGDSSYRARTVHEFDTFILASPDYLKRHKAPQHPSELEQHKVFNYRHCLTGDRWILREPGTENYPSFFVGKATKVDSERLLVSMAERGQGITSALDISCVDQLNSGRLVPVLEDWTYKVPLSLVWASNKSMPKSLRLLIDVLTEKLPGALKVSVAKRGELDVR